MEFSLEIYFLTGTFYKNQAQHLYSKIIYEKEGNILYIIAANIIWNIKWTFNNGAFYDIL